MRIDFIWVLSVILSTIISSGVIGFFIRLYVKHIFDKKIIQIKQENEKELARLEQDIDYLKQVREKRNDATQNALSIIAQSRRTCRYVVALLGRYYLPKEFKDFEQYLDIDDDKILFKDIYKKVQSRTNELYNYRSQLRALIDDNSIWLPREFYRIFHDTFHCYDAFAHTSKRLICKSSDDANTSNTESLEYMKKIYNHIDIEYNKVLEISSKNINNLL